MPAHTLALERHPELVDHAKRSRVLRVDEGDEARQPELVEGVLAGGQGALGGQAPAPRPALQPPADLDVARAVLQAGEADEARQLAARALLGRPQAEAVAHPVVTDRLQGRLGLCAVLGLAAPHPAHHPGVGAQGGEGLEVLVAPAAQEEAVSLRHRPGGAPVRSSPARSSRTFSRYARSSPPSR